MLATKIRNITRDIASCNELMISQVTKLESIREFIKVRLIESARGN